MGRYVTPHGVEIEMDDKAAEVVGYKPAAVKSSQPAKRARKRAPAKREKPEESGE